MGTERAERQAAAIASESTQRADAHTRDECRFAGSISLMVLQATWRAVDLADQISAFFQLIFRLLACAWSGMITISFVWPGRMSVQDLHFHRNPPSCAPCGHHRPSMGIAPGMHGSARRDNVAIAEITSHLGYLR
jgi:hypothetical protein